MSETTNNTIPPMSADDALQLARLGLQEARRHYDEFLGADPADERGPLSRFFTSVPAVEFDPIDEQAANLRYILDKIFPALIYGINHRRVTATPDPESLIFPIREEVEGGNNIYHPVEIDDATNYLPDHAARIDLQFNDLESVFALETTLREAKVKEGQRPFFIVSSQLKLPAKPNSALSLVIVHNMRYFEDFDGTRAFSASEHFIAAISGDRHATMAQLPKWLKPVKTEPVESLSGILHMDYPRNTPPGVRKSGEEGLRVMTLPDGLESGDPGQIIWQDGDEESQVDTVEDILERMCILARYAYDLIPADCKPKPSFLLQRA